MVTACPSAINASTTAGPRKSVPPKTRTFFGVRANTFDVARHQKAERGCRRRSDKPPTIHNGLLFTLRHLNVPKAVHPSARVDADLISITGVPSNASIGPI